MRNLVTKYFDFVRKIVPDREAPLQVGLDIGRTSCKMIQLKPQGEGFEITNWGVEPIAGGETAKAVSALLGRLSPPAASPNASVSGKGSLIRYIDLPRMNAQDAKKSFSLEADKYFPFSINQIYLDCFILDPESKTEKMSVLAAASKKELVDDRMDLLKGLGLQPDFITLDAVALMNLLQQVDHSSAAGDEPAGSGGEEIRKSGAVAILDIGAAVSNLMITVNLLPRFNRDIFIGGQEFTKSIASSLGIGLEEAERLKRDPQEKQAEAIAACDSAVLNLVSELRLSFDYFVTEHNVTIEKLLLVGGGSQVEGLPETLKGYLEIPVMVWNPLESLSVNAAISKEELYRHAPLLGVALGLAMYP